MGNDEDRKCFVGNLNWKTSSDDLHDFFKQWGQIQDARVIMDRDNPFRSRGFGFIVFDRASDASDAVAACNDKEWNVRTLLLHTTPHRNLTSRFSGTSSAESRQIWAEPIQDFIVL
ncbi:hypothetical protein T484DRAFT_1634342 [Baffinella frigidus]|nr:hypothetical protein T484DRAFT_1634342 [Cryptophyta sp. CCMP2293]